MAKLSVSTKSLKICLEHVFLEHKGS
jgi:hypothetical protein